MCINLLFHFFKGNPFEVFVGEFECGLGKSPVNVQGRVIVAEGVFCLWSIDVIHFVLELSHVGKHNKTVCTAAWNEKLLVVLITEFHCYVFAVSRGIFA